MLHLFRVEQIVEKGKQAVPCEYVIATSMTTAVSQYEENVGGIDKIEYVDGSVLVYV